jgi:tRNA pseudouridine55 synthase
MNQVITLNKPIGYTPNQMIDLFREQYPHFAKEKIGFAGRLDPMAGGLLLLLVGDANFEREKYLNLDKTYEFTCLLGLETDSYDLLGILNNEQYIKPPENFEDTVEKFIEESKGTKNQPYPPFSTKPVDGKELFKWAKEGKINEIEIPTKQITIYSFKQTKTATIQVIDLQKHIEENISKIKGMFRQDETINTWQKCLDEIKITEFTTLSFEVKCSSGTYVRSLVHNLGEKLGCGAVTIDIHRTKVGSFSLDKALSLRV